MKYALLVYSDQSTWEALDEEEAARQRAESMPRWLALFEEMGKADPGVGRKGARGGARGEGRAGRGRRARRHRRPVRRDEGADRRPLRDRSPRPRRGDPHRRRSFPRQSMARWRSGRSSSGDSGARGHLPRGMASCRRQSSPASSATSRSPRTRCRTRSRRRSSGGRVTACLAHPGAWIVATARNGAIDRIRRERTFARKAELLARLEDVPAEEDADVSSIPDERLALLFTCCHPALALDARVALTLREVGRAGDTRDRTRVPRLGGDARPTARPREAPSPRDRDSLPRPAGPPPPRADPGRASRPLPRLQRGVRGNGG